MKKFSSTAVLVSFLLLQGGSAIAGLVDAPVCGDVNDSGTVNTTDALQVLRKSVDQPVTLDCSAFDERYEECSADLDACESGTRCGDGIVNSVGEHCDDEDLGGDDCASLGFNAGTLHCDESCKFDTSGCDRCPEGSTLFNGDCWLLGANPLDGEGVGSCDTACSSIGLECNATSLQLIGAGGTNELCRAAADVADPAGAPHPISSSPNTVISKCGPASDYAFGCAVAIGLEPPEINGAMRFIFDGSVTRCDADYYGGVCGTPTRRVCACKP